MCGILYVKLKNSIPNLQPIFEEALSLLSYRGRDNINTSQYANNYFGHARLSILDLSPLSNQPVVSDNHIILFKGEIYNYKNLVTDAVSDTLAIATMIENNIDISNKLCGMYAVLTFQKKSQQVSVIRDFYGEKPVYYYLDDNAFIVSSTIKSIIHILEKAFKKKIKLNQLSLYEFLLSGYIREPKTIYEGIHMLGPGHIMNFNHHDWTLTINNIFKNILKSNSNKNDEYIKNCLISTDVPPAILLSSGVDSTYLLSHLNDTDLKYEALSYKTSESRYDESRAVQENFNKICVNKNAKLTFIENHDDLLGLYEKYPSIMEQPTSDGINLFNILSLSKMYNNNLKLVYIGTGGDELYGGYHSFKNFKKFILLRKLRYLKNIFPKRYRRFTMNLSKDISVAEYYFLYRICPYFLDYIPKIVVNDIFTEFFDDMKKFEVDNMDSIYKKLKLYESFDYMRNQLLRDADNISLYCGYEARNPLLSIPAYLSEPDQKKLMKVMLYKKHGINFGPKKGFTLCDKNSIKDSLILKIRKLNYEYNIFPDDLISRLRKFTISDFYLLRKIFILLAWLEANEIEASQLQGFNVSLVKHSMNLAF